MENRPNPTLPEWSRVGTYTIASGKIHEMMVVDSKELKEGDLVRIRDPFRVIVRIEKERRESALRVTFIECYDYTIDPSTMYWLDISKPSYSIWRLNKTPIY